MSLPTPARGLPAIDFEAALVRRASAGDEAAFERLYRIHVARIHTLVRRIADPGVADDLTQDVFIRAWNKLAQFRGESAFGTWLYRLAINVILSRRRSERSRPEWIETEPEVIEAVGARGTPEGMAMDLEQAIAKLPLGSRQVFILHDVEGWTHEEIAAALGTVPGTSKSQLSRARAALRRMLDGY
jgi:RNA polymerase sigma-70 factor (ECF subfamily)